MVLGISTPFVTMASNMEAGLGPSEGEYTLLTFFIEPKLFVETTVHRYLWGYVDAITEACNTLTPEKCPFFEVGLMMGVSYLLLLGLHEVYALSTTDISAKLLSV
uniref:Niemann-Pick C1 protein n=1 Tax=Mesocestoides corti TaxID=53468 RepID=A0A5K3FXU1_MESCO